MDATRFIAIQDFYSEILNNKRDMFIYLPPSYRENDDQRYPVLYMHDGQHVFFADQKGESWDVHRAVDRLTAEGKMQEIIVVAISHIEDARISEYMHTIPGGHDIFHTDNQGEMYEAFLVREVKPYIDATYRTLADKEHTALMGSSAGGLVSYNIGFRRSDVFGMIGALCPFFVSVDLDTMEERWLSHVYTEKKDLKIWMDVGDAEGFTVMEKHVRQVADVLIASGYKPGEDFMYYYAVDSGHSQKDWAARVHAPLIYFFGDIGKPAHIELRGPQTVGIEGPVRTLNAVVHYDSGFMMTDLNAAYEVNDSERLDVTRDGKILPKTAGKAVITYTKEHVKASLELDVVPRISETARVSIYVKVPPFTPPTEKIYAGIELPRMDDLLYGGTFQVPRDMSFEFRISRGMGKHETNSYGQEIPYRKFTIKDEMVLNYEVEHWIDCPLVNGVS